MDLSAKVDWLRVSLPNDTPLREILPHSEGLQIGHDNVRPFPRYTRAYRFKAGGRVDWNPDQPQQKTLLTFTGSDLDAQQLTGVQAVELAGALSAAPGATVTRLDLAIDILESGADPQTVHDAYVKGEVKSHVRQVDRFDRYRRGQPRAGVNIQFGSRTGERCLRVYDKSAEQGTADPWTRLELELKRAQGMRAAEAIQAQPVSQVAAGLIRELMKTGVPWFEQALDECAAGSFTAAKPGRKQTNSERWLYETATPAFLAALEAGDVKTMRALLSYLEDRGLTLTNL